VPFRGVITNTSSVPVQILTLTDAFPGHSASGICADLIGMVLQPGASATCEWTETAYSPAASDGAKVNTAAVLVGEVGNLDNTAGDQDTSAVTTTPPPPPVLSITIVKTNDADGDGTFTDDETGTTGAAVPFRATITNTSSVTIVIDSLTDIWPGASAITPQCAAAVVGVVLAPGATVTCEFTVTNYVPPATAGPKTNTVTVGAHEETNPDNTTSANDTSVVRGQEVLGESVTQTPPAAAAVQSSTLPRTGAGNTVGLAALGFALIGLGLMMLLATNRQWQWRPAAALASINRTSWTSVQLPAWLEPSRSHNAGPHRVNREMKRNLMRSAPHPPRRR